MAGGDRRGHGFRLDVPWPKDWARAHFTPVTGIGNRVAVGKTVTKVRVEQIVDADLHERVSEQLITFTWPRGATTVHVFRTQKGISAESIVNGPTEQAWGLNRDTWQKDGGFRTPSPLNHNGCAIHLLPVAYHEGRTYPGLPSSLEYVGLRRINYQLGWRRGRTRNATAIRDHRGHRHAKRATVLPDRQPDQIPARQ